MKRLFFVLALAGLFVIAGLAADVAGKWTAEVQTPNGAMTTTFNFTVDGAKLAGTVSGRRGETPIQDGKIDGDNISFVVVRKIQDREMKQTYSGVVAGDEIKFKIEGGRTPEVTAKRAK